MALIDELSKKLVPHTDKISRTLQHSIGRVEDRISDLGKPDTGDQFHHVIRKGKFKGPEPLTVQVGGRGESGPNPGEIWLLQCMCTNGLAIKSPAFVIRTNTGRLIAAVTTEGMGMETPGGDIPVLFGEELVFETAAEGEFDFTMTFKRRFLPRGIPDAIGGVSGERADRPSHGVELSERQMQQIPESPESPWHAQGNSAIFHAQDEGYGGEIDRAGIIGTEPGDTEPET